METPLKRPLGTGFESFTDHGRKVLQLARKAAEERGDGHIGTEHILIGLCRESSGVANHALKALGITPEAIVQEVRRLLGEIHGIPGVSDRVCGVDAYGNPVGVFVWRNGRWAFESK